MSVHLKLTIEPEEYSALLKLALSELRNPEAQLRFILRKELCNMGLLEGEGTVSAEDPIKILDNPNNKE